MPRGQSLLVVQGVMQIGALGSPLVSSMRAQIWLVAQSAPHMHGFSGAAFVAGWQRPPAQLWPSVQSQPGMRSVPMQTFLGVLESPPQKGRLGGQSASLLQLVTQRLLVALCDRQTSPAAQ